MKNSLDQKDFGILDSIRGIAALYVTISHCRGSLWMGVNHLLEVLPRDQWEPWHYAVVMVSILTKLAVEFVIVFFVLSGFSIAHSLKGNPSSGGFYLRRIIRIYPSYIVALIWCLIVYLITKAAFPHWYDGTWTEFSFVRTAGMSNFLETEIILKSLFYMPHSTGLIAPFWSLTYEVMFYILAPFLLRRTPVYVIISLLLFLGNLAFTPLIKSLDIPLYLHEFLFVYNIYFALGVSLYTYFPLVLTFAERFKRSWLLLLLLVALALTYAMNLYFGIETVFSYMSSAFLGVLLIIYFLKFKVFIPWLRWIGSFSYTLYITHFASIFLYLGIYHWFFAPDKMYIENYFIWMPGVLFCIGIAYIQFLLVESRTKNILNRLRKKPRPQERGGIV